MLDNTVTLTTDLICNDWGACIAPKKVDEWLNDRTEFTLREVLKAKVPAKYLLWLVLHPEIIAERHLLELACLYAEHVIKVSDIESDPRSIAAITAKRTWLQGEINDQQLAAAARGAWEAWKVQAAQALRIREITVVRKEIAAWTAYAAAAWMGWETAWEAARATTESMNLLDFTIEYLEGVK